MKVPASFSSFNYFLLLLTFCTLSACNQNSFTGILQQKPWSKSTQSYCAQGSEYFVLKIGEDEYVVKYKDEAELKALDQQKVRIQGILETIKIEPPNTDLPSQVPDMGPTGEAFTCTVLSAKKIKKLEN